MHLPDDLQNLPRYPLLGPHLRRSDLCPISLDVRQPEISRLELTTYEQLEAHIAEHLLRHQASGAIGGYLEKRDLYRSSPHFRTSGADRCIHLGIDIWLPAGSPLFVPLDARVHSFAYNDRPLDYGATILLEHRFGKIHFFTLYGHLSLASLQKLHEGQALQAGQPLATIGNRDENGGWVPHLHLQLITDLRGWKGDFPGVCSEAELDLFRQICPEPTILVVQPEP